MRNSKYSCEVKQKCDFDDCVIRLPEFTAADSEDDNKQVFFVESYNKSKFKGRFVCGMETAVHFANMPIKVVMNSPFLNLSQPQLRNLVKNFSPHKIQFYTIKVDELFADTPIEGMLEVVNMSNTNTKTHISDMMRAALLYKYGGFYLDFDTLTRSDLTNITNSVGLESRYLPSLQCTLQSRGNHQGQKSKWVNNGAMQFNKGNPFMWVYLKEIKEFYHGNMEWQDVGPVIMTTAAKKFLNYTDFYHLIWTYESSELSILPSFTFLYMGKHMTRFYSFDVNYDASLWESIIRCSRVVHLATPFSKYKPVTGNPRRDIYSYLGPKLCPMSLRCLQTFWLIWLDFKNISFDGI